MPGKPVPSAEFATLAQRLVAHFIDVCITFALILVFLIVAAMVESASTLLASGVKYLGVAAGVSYRLLGDGLMGGQAVGKRRMGIRVVDASTGRSCAVWQSVVRAVPLFVPFGNLMDVFYLLLNQRQRLGDRGASTYVVLGSPAPARSRGAA